MSKTYYAIIEAGETEPYGLFYVEDDPTDFNMVSLNRLDKVWQSDLDLIGLFIGHGGGDRAAPVSAEKAASLAESWGCPAP